jgi:ATPase subunit of ABC transporter with duplicated ATPase domains
VSKTTRKATIVVSDLTFETKPGFALFKNLSITFNTEKSGLVGKNGVGKTILLRNLVGELEPTSGRIERRARIAYLPQDYQIDLNLTVGQTIKAEKEHLALAVLARVGLQRITLDRPMSSLSGGERMKVILAHLLVMDADFLILDEPTNNLDSDSRKAVYDLVQNWSGGLLVVSHDRELLRLMDRIFELSEKGLKIYGGNYDTYIAQKELEDTALERQLSDAEREFRKIKTQAQATKEKQQKRTSHGKNIREKTGMPAIILGKMKETSEKTSSRLSALHELRIEDAAQNVAQAREKILPSNAIHVDLSNTKIPTGKLVAAFKDITFRYPETDKPLFHELSFDVYGPSRISIDGPNGSGKTTLVKLMLGVLKPISGEVIQGLADVAYLDQTVAVLDKEETVLENLRRISNLNEGDGRNWLAKFLFSDQDVFKLVGVLSGGERMRAALACILAGDTPPRLLVLDEPTNNLDLNSIEQIESALSNFKGALIVISHDKEFIKNIGVERSIVLGEVE